MGQIVPPLPGARGAPPPAPPSGFGAQAREAEKESESKLEKVKDEYEKRMSQLERRLQDEREKTLVNQIKSQEEQVTAAKVEVSLKELQDRLRRDRRDQDQEEAKAKLEKRAEELETRLAQERETWVVTLKNQLAAREGQDKEVEVHFAMRIQEMERRWLEEKANWQRVAMAKDEEIRTLRSLAEKLKGADTELSKISMEKKILDERVTELSKDRAEALARLHNASERENESIQIKAELLLSRQQAAMIQERLERDLASLRSSAREREERLLADQERLQRDLATVKQRFDAEKDSELRRVKVENEADLARHKEAAERANAELQRLRAVCGALEQQAASSVAQINELKSSSEELNKTQEYYKAEFVVLQRKWVEREKEVRAEVAEQSLQKCVEKDAELRRVKIEYEADLARHKEAAERAGVELQRLRAVCGALERQGASSRAQLDKLKRSSAEWEKTQERYKAEFVVLQRKWVEREKEIRAEAAEKSLQMLESEKTRLKIMAQAEINARAAKISDQLRKETESAKSRLEGDLRVELEGEFQIRLQELKVEREAVRTQLENEISRLRRESAQKEAAWSERLLAKESEVIASRTCADEAARRLSLEEESRQAADRRAFELEKSVQDAREQGTVLQNSLRALRQRLEEAEAGTGRLEREKTEFERLFSAQSAQAQCVQESLEQARTQLARESQSAKIAQNALDQAEKSLGSLRQELILNTQAQKTEFERALAQKDQEILQLIAQARELQLGRERLAAEAAGKAREQAQSSASDLPEQGGS
ncbi:MAG: hypothetical protein A2X37_00975 [Elusimicrobia bacterium GWA2_66_18]|nr:MAG: hypothetical protein A2X37_00975 [Elusimicrobia bacterium GWA2_66_18]